MPHIKYFLFFKYFSLFQTRKLSNTSYFRKATCLEADLSAESKTTSFQRLLAIYSHQLEFGATVQIVSSKSTCELALCSTRFMISHPRLKFTLSLSNVIKLEEGL